MSISVFSNHGKSHLIQPMFLGENVNVSRFDTQRHAVFEKLIEKQLSFFWRPEEVDVSKDRIDYQSLPDHEKHIFVSNLKYQTLLDSIQGRAPNLAYLPIVSIPELETWIETWSFSETIHSRSYTHIQRNIFSDPTETIDSIVKIPEIIERAKDITRYYDNLIELVNYYNSSGVGVYHKDGRVIDVSIRSIKKALYLSVISTYGLEGIRFYVSFACSFAFAERELMEGNAKIIKLIARDEALHLSGTMHIINLFKEENDPEMNEVIAECYDEAMSIFRKIAEQEKNWGKYLFQFGSMIGLNSEIINDYIEYITDLKMIMIGFNPIFGRKSNPLPWINHWLTSTNVQVAPQETEISSYLTGAVDSNVSSADLAALDADF